MSDITTEQMLSWLHGRYASLFIPNGHNQPLTEMFEAIRTRLTEYDTLVEVIHDLTTDLNKAEAELERARPLLGAVMALRLDPERWVNDGKALFQAALDYRKEDAK